MDEARQQSIDRCVAVRGDEIAFILLFASRTRGDSLPHSDYDVLIGLTIDDLKRFIDRILDFQEINPNAEVLPYARSEWQRLFEDDRPILLNALEDGIVLHERGALAEVRERFRGRRRSGEIHPLYNGWTAAAGRNLKGSLPTAPTQPAESGRLGDFMSNRSAVRYPT